MTRDEFVEALEERGLRIRAMHLKLGDELGESHPGVRLLGRAIEGTATREFKKVTPLKGYRNAMSCIIVTAEELEFLKTGGAVFLTVKAGARLLIPFSLHPDTSSNYLADRLYELLIL